MTSNRNCCVGDYCVRVYDLSLNKLSSGNYFDGIPYATVILNDWKTLCGRFVEGDSKFYVGGSRVEAGGEFWSVAAFDAVTGERLWKRDLYDDISSVSATYTNTFNSGTSQTYIALYDGTLEIEMWGAGGSPDAGILSEKDGAQAGGYCKKTISILAGQTVNYTVGQASHGTNGGNSTASKGGMSTMTAAGGSKTTSGAGTATNGDINTTGGSGTAGAFDEGGAGGNSPNGGTGGAGGDSGAPGDDGNAPGGGGGGAGNGGGLSGLGGAGRAKFVLTVSDPIGYLGDVIAIQKNSSGNIVCMLDPENATSEFRYQHFVELETDGTLVGVYKFQQQYASNTTTESRPTLGLTVDEDDTYHLLSWRTSYAVVPHTDGPTLSMYELPSAYTAATLYEGGLTWASESPVRSMIPEQIVRFGGRDYVSGRTFNYDQPTWRNPAILIGKSQTQSIRAWSDVDDVVPRFPTGLTSDGSVAPTGSIQGDAVALNLNHSCRLDPTGAGQGAILPSGASAGDVVITSNGGVHTVKVYPSVGGHIIQYDNFNNEAISNSLHTEYTVNQPFLMPALTIGSGADCFYSIGSDVWVLLTAASGYKADGHTVLLSQLVRWLPTLDSSSNIIAVTPRGEIVKHDANQTPIWWSGQTHIHTVCDDADNIYAIGVRAIDGASVVKRDSDGSWVAGHQHHGDRETNLFDAQKYPSMIFFDPDGDGGNGSIIAIGQIAKTSADVNFVGDPW